MEPQGELVRDTLAISDVSIFAAEKIVAGIWITREYKATRNTKGGFEVTANGGKE